MDTKELVDKFINGDITEEQFDAEKAKLTPEDQEKLKKEAEDKLPDAVEKLKNVRRGADKIKEKQEKDNQNQNNDLALKLREENFVSARDKFFADNGIVKDEDKKAFEEGFKKHDSGAVTPDNISKDMKAYFASTNADEFFNLRQEKIKREQEAEEFNANNGGSGGGGEGGDKTKKVSKEVEAFMKASAKQGRVITAEQAEKALKIAANRGHLS